jgi:hypothetical protein
MRLDRNALLALWKLDECMPAIQALPQTTGPHTIQTIYGGDMNFFHNNSNQVVVTVQ